MKSERQKLISDILQKAISGKDAVVEKDASSTCYAIIFAYDLNEAKKVKDKARKSRKTIDDLESDEERGLRPTHRFELSSQMGISRDKNGNIVSMTYEEVVLSSDRDDYKDQEVVIGLNPEGQIRIHTYLHLGENSRSEELLVHKDQFELKDGYIYRMYVEPHNHGGNWLYVSYVGVDRLHALKLVEEREHLRQEFISELN